MSEFTREIDKLEVRLADFMKQNESFAEQPRSSIELFKELDCRLQKEQLEGERRISPELKKLKEKALEAFSLALREASRAEHEKSHLLESYGPLILTLETRIRVKRPE